MTLVQGFFRAILSKGNYEDMERQSRSWMMQCPNCRHERSIWELGGIRWKAAGNPRRYMSCPNCNQKNWHTVYKKS